MRSNHLNLGQLISTLYAEYLEIYGDEDLAAVATAATIQEILAEAALAEDTQEEAA